MGTVTKDYVRAAEEQVTEGRLQLVTLYTRILRALVAQPTKAQETLARDLNCTMRTVQRHINDLEREGYIRIYKHKKPYTYTVDVEKRVPYMEAGYRVHDLIFSL
jgi:DNA-binding transcriptional regulator LsrR (DeoR family)